MTVGPGIDAAGLRVPQNAAMHAWLDHDEVLATASLVVGHGGHSTAMRALSFGVPQVVMPANPMIDQKGVGAALERVGAGMLLRKHAGLKRIRAAIQRMLNDSSSAMRPTGSGHRSGSATAARWPPTPSCEFVRTRSSSDPRLCCRAVRRPSRSAAAPCQRFGGNAGQAAELEVHCVGLGQPPLVQLRRRSARMHCCGKAASSAANSSAFSASFTGRHDAIGQAHRQGLGGVDAAAGEDHVHRAAVADQPRQPNRAAVDQRDAPASAEDAHGRVLLHHPQVAPQRQFQAAGHRVPADSGDHRFGQHHPARAHRPWPRAMGGVDVGGTERLEIGTGTEGSVVTPQHRDRRGLVACRTRRRRRTVRRRPGH